MRRKPTPSVAEQLIRSWRRRLRRVHARLRREPRSSEVWSLRLRERVLVFLLRRYGDRPGPARRDIEAPRERPRPERIEKPVRFADDVRSPVPPRARLDPSVVRRMHDRLVDIAAVNRTVDRPMVELAPTPSARGLQGLPTPRPRPARRPWAFHQYLDVLLLFWVPLLYPLVLACGMLERPVVGFVFANAIILVGMGTFALTFHHYATRRRDRW